MAEPRATNAAGRAGLAEAGRNRTNLSTLPRRNNGFEDRGSHQTPFASSDREKNADDNIRDGENIVAMDLRGRT